MNQNRLFSNILALFLLLLLTAVPIAAAAPIAPPSTGYLYLPLIASHPCPPTHPKAAVALAYHELGIAHNHICQPKSNYYHNWRWTYGEDGRGVRIPMVWDEKALPLWNTFREQWEAENEQPYSGYLLVANEPDRPDQANMTPAEVADLILSIIEDCPLCKLIGPMYSAADAGWLAAEVWQLVEETCGSPCPLIQNNLYAHGPHIYPRPDKNFGPSARVDEFCQIVDGGDCQKPIWVTEFGYRTCFGHPYLIFKDWTREAFADPRIEQVFIYSTYQRPQSTCHFWGMLDFRAKEQGIEQLTPIGRAWRDAIIESSALD